MVRLVKNLTNKIIVKVTSTIDYTGFSAELSVAGISKSISDLKQSGLSLYFSPDEVSMIEESAEGFLDIFDAKGNLYVTNSIWFGVVPLQGNAIGYQQISIVLVSMLKYEGGKGRSRTEADIEKMIDAKVKPAVDEAIDSVIDDKVAVSVEKIIDPKVEEAVDAVIDAKVETVVNEIFDDSDSDTIGGRFSAMEQAVADLEPRVESVEQQIDDNLEPRLAEVETTLDKKISMDYDTSDDEIIFLNAINALDHSDTNP